MHQPYSSPPAIAKIRKHKDKAGALLPVLHALMEEFGYIDDDVVPLIATELNLSKADVHGVVSFYHDFRQTPPAQHRLQICRA